VTSWLIPSASQKTPVQPGWYLPPQKISFAENRFLRAGKGAENIKRKIQAVLYDAVRATSSKGAPDGKIPLELLLAASGCVTLVLMSTNGGSLSTINPSLILLLRFLILLSFYNLAAKKRVYKRRTTPLLLQTNQLD